MAIKNPIEKQRAQKQDRKLQLIESKCTVREHVRDGIAAIAYTYEMDNRFLAIAYKGKAIKPKWHCFYKSPEDRKIAIERFFDNLANEQQLKEEQREGKQKKRSELAKKIAPGTLLKGSWGYDQTNVDFYQITKKFSQFKVGIARIAEEEVPNSIQFDSCRVRPVKDKFISQEEIHIITSFGIKTSLSTLRIIEPDSEHYKSWGR